MGAVPQDQAKKHHAPQNRAGGKDVGSSLFSRTPLKWNSRSRIKQLRSDRDGSYGTAGNCTFSGFPKFTGGLGSHCVLTCEYLQRESAGDRCGRGQ